MSKPAQASQSASQPQRRHPEELSDDILIGLGFGRVTGPWGQPCWVHPRRPSQTYHMIMTARGTAQILIELGQELMREQVVQAVSNLDL
jgi:hypothetical protein